MRRTRKAQEVQTQKTADVEVTVTQATADINEEKEVGIVEVSAESQAASSSSSPAWKQAANSLSNENTSSYNRPVTRTNRPTPEWLKAVRPQSSTSPGSMNDNHSVTPQIKRIAQPTPEWMKRTHPAETKRIDLLPSKYKPSKPLVTGVSIEEGRDDDDDVSAASDFKSVMSKWKAVENRNS